MVSLKERYKIVSMGIQEKVVYLSDESLYII